MQNPSSPPIARMKAASITMTVPMPSKWRHDTMDFINEVLKCAQIPWAFFQVLTETGKRFTMARHMDTDRIVNISDHEEITIHKESISQPG